MAVGIVAEAPSAGISTLAVVGGGAEVANGVGNVAAGANALAMAIKGKGSGTTPPKPATTGGTPAGQRVNMPSWKDINIDMEEVSSGHMTGGSRLAPGNKKDLFPEGMNQAQVEKAIRGAYREGEILQSQGTDRVFVRGPFGSGTIEMWVNKATKTIETAWPK